MRLFSFALATIVALPVTAWGQAPAFPVKDINNRPYANPSYPRGFITVDSTTFFFANATSELWKTDGTPEGTSRLATVGWPAVLIAGIDGKLFFTGGSDDGFALWTSDGTAAGTIPVTEITRESFDYCNNFGSAVAGQKLYFVTCEDRYKSTLWVSDGTALGTMPLTALGSDDTRVDRPYFTAVNGTLFFVNSESATGLELWKTDGSPEGTVLVQDLRRGRESSSPLPLGALDGILIFTASDGQAWSLWRSDGTSAGTRRFSDVTPSDLNAVAIDGSLYFTGRRPVRGALNGLWKTDGTTAGTIRLKADLAPAQLTNVDGTLFFTALRTQLWKSDGTVGGTELLANPVLTFDGSLDVLTHADGVLYFRAYDYTSDELWRSDGTAAGTLPLANLFPEAGHVPYYPPAAFAVAGRTLLFIVSSLPIDGSTGVDLDLWKSDGTPEGTVAVKDLDPDDGNVWVLDTGFELVGGNGAVFFAANSHESGIEPWMSDGTVDGTLQLANIGPDGGTLSAYPVPLGAVGSTLLFAADDGHHGMELWRSDGTEAGTVLVRDISPGPGSSFTTGPVAVVGDVLYSEFFDPDTGSELWRSDGTTSGTRILADLCPDFGGGISWLTAVGESLYIATHLGDGGEQIWKSDGTADGTVRVGDPFRTSTRPAALNGRLVFVTGTELWKSDGSAGGTVLVKDLGAMSTGIAVVDDTLFIATYAAVEHGGDPFALLGAEIWKSDGTAAGTTLVKRIEASTYFIARDLSAADGVLFFVTTTGYHGPLALWRSDGTAAGTAPVMELGHSYRSAVVGDTLYFSATPPDALTVGLYRADRTATTLVKEVFADWMSDAGGRLVFTGCDSLSGCEVWASDGTSAGTRLLADVEAGPSSSLPHHFMAAEPFVFFSAVTGRATDSELWAIPLSDLGMPPVPTCIGDCDADRVVSVDELVTMVERAMGRFPIRDCAAGDGDQDGQVRVEEIVAAVANALGGCPGA